MAQHDLVVSFLSSVPGSVLPLFEKKPLQVVSPVTQKAGPKWPGGRLGYRQWLQHHADENGNVIPGLARAAGAQTGDTIGRVAVIGFSNGCIGVDETLGFNDSVKIDTVLAIDGIHGNFGVDGQLVPNHYKHYLNHAAHVLARDPEYDTGAPVMCISHSSINPMTFPSTTATADLIWHLAMTKAPADVTTLKCGYPCVPVQRMEALASYGEDVKACAQNGCFTWKGFADGWYDRRMANNLYVFGWGDLTPSGAKTKDPLGYADHVFQGRFVLDVLLAQLCAKRWSSVCDPVATAGFGAFGAAASCKPPEGQLYDSAPNDKVDHFPNLSDEPGGGGIVPEPCPAPPPGYVVVGTKSNPCATIGPSGGGPPPPPPAGEEPPSRLAQVAVGTLGVAAGFGVAQAAARWWSRRAR